MKACLGSLVVLVATGFASACHFDAAWSSSGTGTPAAAPLPPPPPPAPVPRATAAPSPPPTQQNVTKAPPVLSPADLAALLQGTWRRLPIIKTTRPPTPGATPAPAPASMQGCLDVGASANVPGCAVHTALLCSASTMAARRCQTYATTMVPTVAASAVDCMNRLSGVSVCDPVEISACGHRALSQACPDPGTVAPLCQIAADPCKSSQSDCVALLSGLTFDAQDAVARCVAKGCSAGLYACVEGLGTN